VSSPSVGIDLIEIDRVARALARHGGRFAERCFTPAEREYCDGKANPAQHYAGRFAAKEAVGKALGSGVPFTWREIEIAGPGKPRVILSGSSARRALELGAGAIELSITHSRTLAAAVAAVSLQ
jgi:holo-[acyl-carrier protein] synthase